MIESNDWRLEAGLIGPHKEKIKNIPIYQIDYFPLSEERDHEHCALVGRNLVPMKDVYRWVTVQ